MTAPITAAPSSTYKITTLFETGGGVIPAALAPKVVRARPMSLEVAIIAQAACESNVFIACATTPVESVQASVKLMLWAALSAVPHALVIYDSRVCLYDAFSFAIWLRTDAGSASTVVMAAEARFSMLQLNVTVAWFSQVAWRRGHFWAMISHTTAWFVF
jgi:hypothetical protein